MVERTFAWHVTPKFNVASILQFGLKPNLPEPDGDFMFTRAAESPQAVKAVRPR